jgi:hypothetical protein
MPVWPKFVYTIDVSLRAAATRRKLRDAHAPAAQQDATFRTRVGSVAGTSYGKQYGVEASMSYGQFQARVPLQTYERIASFVAEMQRGGKDVLWPGECPLFGLTSGTSGGEPKCVPMTDALLAHFRHAGMEALLFYVARAGNCGVFQGRHVCYGAPATLQPFTEAGYPSAASEVTGIAALHLPRWVEQHLYEPGREIAGMSRDAQMDAIATKTAACDVTLIAGVPHGVGLLSAALREKFFGEQSPERSLQDQWPNLECFAHTGAALAPHAAELRLALGPRVGFHEIYAASEGIIAAQDTEPGRGLRVMADMGIFFEFVTLAEFDDLRLDQLGPKAVPMSGAKTGVDYVILLTTPGGLTRYVLGDVVRFTSVLPPRLLVVGGTELRLNALGENVTERDVTDAIVTLCERRGWTLVNFHVAPLFAAGIMTGQRRGAHEWWVELRPGTVVTPTGPQMALELDSSLRETSPGYAARRAAGTIEAPVVRLVMPGVFEHWLRFHQKWGGQAKMPRCRSDRRVADEFAQMTNFARD